MTFAKHGGPQMVERKPRYWCLSAPHYDDRTAHVFCGEYIVDHLVPTSEELEELGVAAEAERAQTAKPKASSSSSSSKPLGKK